MKTWVNTLVVLLVIVSAVFAQQIPSAQAHQPYCESADLSLESPFRVKDPTISTAFYGTLFPEEDVDYFVFRGAAGQDILLGITIPQIDGYEAFAPTFALFGPGLERGESPALPDRVIAPPNAGVVLFPSSDDAPTSFFEPFSRTSYWERQEALVTLPEDGQYTIALWHDEGQVGRYVMVIGEREVIGGDLVCLMGLDHFFTPIDPMVERARLGEVQHNSGGDGGTTHGHSAGDDHTSEKPQTGKSGHAAADSRSDVH